MTLRVQFVGGPADGIERTYPDLELALPSLYWQDETTRNADAYHRDGDRPAPENGAWRYTFSRS